MLLSATTAPFHIAFTGIPPTFSIPVVCAYCLVSCDARMRLAPRQKAGADGQSARPHRVARVGLQLRFERCVGRLNQAGPVREKDGGHALHATVWPPHELHCLRIVLDVHLYVGDAERGEDTFRSPAITTPRCGVHHDRMISRHHRCAPPTYSRHHVLSIVSNQHRPSDGMNPSRMSSVSQADQRWGFSCGFIPQVVLPGADGERYRDACPNIPPARQTFCSADYTWNTRRLASL